MKRSSAVRAPRSLEAMKRRTGHFCRVSVPLRPVFEICGAARGFPDSTLFRQWPAVVGEEMAQFMHPSAIRYSRRAGSGERPCGELIVLVSRARLSEACHLRPRLRERVNSFFGYRAIGEIRITALPRTAASLAPRRSSDAPSPPRAPGAEAGINPEIDAILASITHEKLREALTCLGRAVMARRGKRSEKGADAAHH